MPPTTEDLRFLYAYPDVERPWVRSNFVSTLDGAAHASDGKSGVLGGDIDSAAFTVMRSLADVVLVGAGTARDEGYRPADLPLALVSRSLDIPSTLLTSPQVVITTADADPDALEAVRSKVEVIACGEGQIDWPRVLEQFDARGWRKILCEGGPSLHGTLVGLDLIDEVCLTVAPVLAAGQAPRIAHSTSADDRAMTLSHCVQVGDVLLTRWVRDRSPSPEG
jgi:riboflavin biosynthesis pyrimidine reductase